MMNDLLFLFRCIIEASATIVSLLSIILIFSNSGQGTASGQKLLMKQIMIFSAIIVLSSAVYMVAR
jgi:hypothetical protein